MKDILVVDGYNVVNAWPVLMKIKEQNLSHARDRLLDILLGYGTYKDFNVVVVFDAHEVVGSLEVHELCGNVEVVYTKEGETADSYIEKLVYNLVKQGERVFVVTSDWAEQLVALWAGAYRISARELLQDYLAVSSLIETKYSKSVLRNERNEIESRLNYEVLKRLNEIRMKS